MKNMNASMINMVEIADAHLNNAYLANYSAVCKALTYAVNALRAGASEAALNYLMETQKDIPAMRYDEEGDDDSDSDGDEAPPIDEDRFLSRPH